MSQRSGHAWNPVPLGSLLAVLESGSRPRGGATATGIFSVGGEHLDGRGGFRLDRQRFVPADYAAKMRRGWIRPGDVLVVKDGATTGKVSLVRESFPLSEAVVNEHVVICRPNDRLDSAFLYHYLSSSSGKAQVLSDFRGAAQGGITKGFVDRVVLPLPTRRIQAAVVGLIEQQIDRVSAALRAAERARENIRRFRMSVLSAAATGRLSGASHSIHETVDPRDLGLVAPQHWRQITLDDLVEPGRPICYGILKPRVGDSGTVPYVEVRDLGRGPLDAAKLNMTSAALAQEFARSTLRAGDVLVAVRGSYDRVGIVPAELEGANLSRDVARVSVRDDVDPRYVALYLSSPAAQDYFSRVARGVAVKGVNIGDLRKTPIVLPPADEQRVIVEEVDRNLTQIEHLDREVSRSMLRARSLQDSILGAAFSGQLLYGDLPR
jgi:type I restriction enzyme, S subunit